MILIRRLVLASMKWNVIFRSKHIQGKTNIVADLLSRSQFQKAHKVAPWLSSAPADIPVHLLKVQMCKLYNCFVLDCQSPQDNHIDVVGNYSTALKEISVLLSHYPTQSFVISSVIYLRNHSAQEPLHPTFQLSATFIKF